MVIFRYINQLGITLSTSEKIWKIEISVRIETNKTSYEDTFNTFKDAKAFYDNVIKNLDTQEIVPSVKENE